MNGMWMPPPETFEAIKYDTPKFQAGWTICAPRSCVRQVRRLLMLRIRPMECRGSGVVDDGFARYPWLTVHRAAPRQNTLSDFINSVPAIRLASFRHRSRPVTLCRPRRGGLNGSRRRNRSVSPKAAMIHGTTPNPALPAGGCSACQHSLTCAVR